jgi:glycosyltransferase involved in cell wall biosynthesis
MANSDCNIVPEVKVPGHVDPGLPLVSILIPCYNARPWIGQCIRSALDTQYPRKEILVLDDGSTDGSRDVVEAFGDRIRFVPGSHAGSNVARNRLTSLARGEWLQFLDADDYILPGKISSQVDFIRQWAGAVDVVYSPMICHSLEHSEPDWVTRIYSDDATLNYIRWEPLNTIGMLLRKEAVLHVGGWKEDQPCCQEHELLLRLLMAGARFQSLNKPGAVARLHNAESVSRKDPLRTIRVRMELTDRAANYLQSSGRLGPEHRRALFVARMESARSAYQQDPILAEELCRKAIAAGKWWRTSSPALGLRYQFALRTLGFQRTERLAAWNRERERRRVAPKGPREPGNIDSAKNAPAPRMPSTVQCGHTWPLVSILVPAYNAERWIGQCIQSALDQDYPHKEVIVVDDGSTDGSRKIIETFGERVQFAPGPHAGGNAARNRLTELAQGEWLQYLDADDYLLPGKLASQVARIMECAGTADVVYSPVLCQNVVPPSVSFRTRLYEGDALLNFIRWEPFQTTGMLFRRDAVLRVGGWKQDQPCCQEHELLLRLLMAGSRCEPCPKAGSIYRFESEDSVSRKDPLQTIRVRMELTDRAEQFLRATGGATRGHRRALFAARMESARSAYLGDPQLADELSAKALADAKWWHMSSRALRWRYLLPLRIVGFRRTESLATWYRVSLCKCPGSRQTSGGTAPLGR